MPVHTHIHRPTTRRTLAMLAPAVAVCASALVACGSDEAAAERTIEVTGTNDACKISEDSFGSGTVAFEFTNTADKVSELYVLKQGGEVVSEVENVTSGTKRTLTVELNPGDHEVRCKPGQSGDGFSTPFDVTGEQVTQEAAPDRTVTFDAVDFTYTDLDLGDVKEGETIRFEMANSGTQDHEFEILLPDGDALGEIGAVGPGESGSATMTFEKAGEYSYQCILKDEASHKGHDALGMKGTFTVS